MLGPACGFPGGCSVSDPINPFTGNVFKPFTLVPCAPSGGVESNCLGLDLYYNSQAVITNPTGLAKREGLNFSLSIVDHSLQFQSTNGTTTSINYVRDNGQVVTFAPNANGVWVVSTPNGSGGFQPVPNMAGYKLVQSGSTWTVTDTNNTQYIFSALSNGQAELAAIKSLGGYEKFLTYNPNQIVISDTYTSTNPGRVITVNYQNGILSSIVAPGGMTITFKVGFSSPAATAPDQLQSITFSGDGTTPVFGNSPDPVTWTLQYNDPNNSPTSVYNLTALLDGNTIDGVPVTAENWAYDNEGHATQNSQGTGLNATTLVYNPDGTRKVTDGRGQPYILTPRQAAGGSQLAEITRLSMPGDSATGNVPAFSPTPQAKKDFSYDENGCPSGGTDWKGIRTIVVNDANCQPLTVTEAAGTPVARTTTNVWLPGVLNVLQSTTLSAGDPALGNLTPVQNVTYSNFDIHYNAQAMVTTDLLTASHPTRTEGSTYDATSHLLTYTDALKNTYINTYNGANLATTTNPLGQTMQYNLYSPAGWLLESIDPNNDIRSQTFSLRGYQTSSSISDGKTTLTTSNVIDAAGNVLAITPPSGNTVTYTINSAYWVTGITNKLGEQQIFAYNNAGDLIGMTYENAAGQVTYQRQRGIDPRGYLLAEAGAYPGQVTNYTVDDNGDDIAVTDPTNDTTTYVRDALRRVSLTGNPDGGIINTTYNVFDERTLVIDANGNQTVDIYNGFGDNTETQSPDAGMKDRTFDADGDLQTSRDSRNQLTTFKRDAIQRPIKITYTTDSGATSAATFVYDKARIGRLSFAQGPQGETVKLSYNSYGNLTQKQQTIAGRIFNTGWQYDQFQRNNGMVYPSGLAVTYGFDAASQINQVNVKGKPVASNVTHMPWGPVSGWVTADKDNISHIYDKNYLMTNYSLANGAATVTYDPAFYVSSVLDPDGLHSVKTDAMHRIKTFTVQGNTGNISIGYAYDLNGNRRTETAAVQGKKTETTDFTIDKNSDMLEGVIEPGGAKETIEEDANGSITQIGGMKLTYDARGLLVAAGPFGYLNDFTGQLVERFGPNDVRDTIYDGPNPVGQYSLFGGYSYETIRLEGIPIAIATDGAEQKAADVLKVYVNNLYTPREVVAPRDGQTIYGQKGGQMLWTWSLNDPFGGNAPVENGFTLYERETGQSAEKTGLVYNNARYFWPLAGRFMQSDPAGQTGLGGGDANTYDFVGNNPMNDVDPTGLCPVGAPDCIEPVFPEFWAIGSLLGPETPSLVRLAFAFARNAFTQPSQPDAASNASPQDPMECPNTDEFWAGRMTLAGREAAQRFVDKYNTVLDLVGSGATGRRGHINQPDWPTEIEVPGPDGTDVNEKGARSDADFKILGSDELKYGHQFTDEVIAIENGAGKPMQSYGQTQRPFIRWQKGQRPTYYP